MTDGQHDPLSRTVPTARVTGRRISWAWLVPLAALAVAIWVGLKVREDRGPLISVHAQEGHSIHPGDPVRYRGIDVGLVESVDLHEDLSHVVVNARLSAKAKGLARAGTRFWIVRPHLSLDEVTGLETIFGARYLEATPGPETDVPQTEFVALKEPPVLLDTEPGGLEFVLVAKSRFGLQPGAPLTYRNMPIGRVMSVGLASDASTIEVRSYVAPRYARLICENTQFWEASGIEFDLGLFGGLQVGLESLRALFVGAIALATPDAPGERVLTGHRFTLHEEPKPEWIEWRPSLPIGNALLPSEAPTPRPLRASLSWSVDRLFGRREYGHSGWVIAIDGGLIGPSELLAPDGLDEKDDVELQVSGTRIALPGTIKWKNNNVTLLSDVGAIGIPWPKEWSRTPTAPEDVLLVGDPARTPMAISSGRVAVDEHGVWRLDGSLGMDDGWHGAGAFARADGNLVGILLNDEKKPRIVPLPGL